jgi:hypothetical protein
MQINLKRGRQVLIPLLNSALYPETKEILDSVNNTLNNIFYISILSWFI